MTTYISLLRGVNVSGQKAIRMPDLKQMVEAMGLRQAVTYVQSGNVIFQTEEAGPERLEAALSAEIQRVFGFVVVVLVRSVPELQRVANSNPFLQRQADLLGLHVTFLKQQPDPALVSLLSVPAGETDDFSVGKQEVFLICPNGYGRTKLSNGFFERKLKMAATTRNWKTVNALLELAQKG